MREADERMVCSLSWERRHFVFLDSVSRMAKSRYGELTPLGARQHKGIAERMYKNFPEVFKGEAEVDACSTVVIRCILSMAAECLKLQSLNPKLQFKNDASYADMYYMNNDDPYVKTLCKADEVVEAKAAIRKEHVHPERLMKALFNNEDYVNWKVDAGRLMTGCLMWQATCRVSTRIWNFTLSSPKTNAMICGKSATRIGIYPMAPSPLTKSENTLYGIQSAGKYTEYGRHLHREEREQRNFTFRP